MWPKTLQVAEILFSSCNQQHRFLNKVTQWLRPKPIGDIFFAVFMLVARSSVALLRLRPVPHRLPHLCVRVAELLAFNFGANLNCVASVWGLFFTREACGSQQKYTVNRSVDSHIDILPAVCTDTCVRAAAV